VAFWVRLPHDGMYERTQFLKSLRPRLLPWERNHNVPATCWYPPNTLHKIWCVVDRAS